MRDVRDDTANPRPMLCNCKLASLSILVTHEWQGLSVHKRCLQIHRDFLFLSSNFDTTYIQHTFRLLLFYI